MMAYLIAKCPEEMQDMLIMAGNHSYLDQYASENLCVDEPVI